MSKCKNLTDGMVSTVEQTQCFMYAGDCGLQQGIKTITPNPDDPLSPIITYTADGVVIPKPDKMYPCFEPGAARPVYVVGQACPNGAVEECPEPTNIGVITDMSLLDQS